MQKICILIEREKLFAFKEDGGKYYTQFIQGNESFDYSLSTLRNDFERFIEELKNEFNYDSADFSFIVVLNYDSYRNSIIRSEILGERIFPAKGARFVNCSYSMLLLSGQSNTKSKIKRKY